VFCAAAFIATGSASAQQSDGTFNYIRRDTRDASRDATLAQYRAKLEWKPWWVIGPFDNTGMDKHAMVYAPELGVDLERPIVGKNGRLLHWELLEQDLGLPVDLARFGTEEDNLFGIAYLHREVIAETAAQVQVEMGSDDGLKFWLNGELLVDADVYRGMNPSDHRITLNLRHGVNTILVKVTQGQGGWQYQLSTWIDSRLLAKLHYHLDQDFPISPEAVHYRALSILEPEDCVLEVGGLDVLPDGRPVVVTRRGEVWVVDGAYADPPFDATYHLIASGLHEPLGIRYRDGALLTVQRGELTRLIDEDGDGTIDFYESMSDPFPISGNYHEYAFGPKFDGDGRMWVTLNVGFCGSLGKSIVPWRGWALIVEPDGSLTPVCGGLRSPNGIGANDAGDMFFTDNQGDWVGTNKLSHLEFGDWHGHPSSTTWYESAGMKPPDGEKDFKQPAIWFPYDRMGRSASDIELDATGGAFGPFENQLFVGDQYAATIMRVDLEHVGGAYQGVCFPFLKELDSGVNRLRFGPDGSLFVGMTNRGWWSYGARPWGLQRIVYTGVLPFEMLTVRAKPDGFVVRFTEPVNPATATALDSWSVGSFTHHRWEPYGSPEIEFQAHAVSRITVAEDRLSARLIIPGIRAGYVHEIHATGVRNLHGKPLLHADAYYTLNRIPAE
jgi:glucose/arabinose dehydrogenase